VQKKVLWASPFVMSLNRIDHWFWSRYFIDVYPECPYACSYCNTLRRGHVRGLSYRHGLPEKGSTIGLGLLSDIYHPEPGNNKITRRILEILLGREHGVSIQTKATTIAHDLDLLRHFAKRRSLRVTFTILTLDTSIWRKIEGHAPSPMERLNTLSMLAEADIPVGIAILPIIPSLTDDPQELTRLVREAKRRGAGWVLFSGFTPVSSFLEHPSMGTARALHNDGESLATRYREIKRFMINLLRREGISLRIPRPNPGPPDQRFHRRSVSEYLFNISYYHELLENPVESARFRRAAHQINDLESSIKSIVFRKKLGYIKGINPEIEKIIEDIVVNGSCDLCENLEKKL
jgi:hypothetical protein